MQSTKTDPPTKTIATITVVVIVTIIALVGVFSWVLTRGVEDDQNNTPVTPQQSTETIPNEPSNPNVNGDTSSPGNETSTNSDQ